MTRPPLFSVIIPVLNEEKCIGATLQALRPVSDLEGEVVVVDGDSHDRTVEICSQYTDVVIQSARGRASQMNAGAAVATGNLLFFLHADTLVDDEALQFLQRTARSDHNIWGRFDIRFSAQTSSLKLIGVMMNLRSRLSGIATGDQGIFVHRSLFELAEGYAPIPLMEDVDLSRKLKKLCKPVCSRIKLTTSSRRWEERGTWKTVFLMYRLRLAYFLGADPHKLSARYQ